jgi:threonine/homoserine/homoserine lactone efflux protein
VNHPVFGLSFLTESTVFNTLLTAFGVMVLAYLSYNSFRDFFTSEEIDASGEVDSNAHFVPGIVLTISNPAILLLWAGIMGADLAASRSSLGEGLSLGLGILIGVFLFFVCLTALIHYGRRYLQQRYFRYVSLVAGIVLLYFCVRFAYSLLTLFV